MLPLEHELPLAADEQAVRVGFAQWEEQAAEAAPAVADFMRALAADRNDRQLLTSIFGNSPYLTQSLLKEPAFLMRLAKSGHRAVFAELLAALETPDDQKTLMADLRQLKRRAALTIALADIAQWWMLDEVMRGLTAFAEGALDRIVRHLLGAAMANGEIEDPHGFIVLGMGKLGAFELNYSSDVDLILLYDADKVRYRGRQDVQRFFTRLAHDLVRLMSETTEDGYVFRTDLRLRPDPGSTPPVVSVMAALAYYESAGQNWERAALIKARPVAGDRAAGAAFLAELEPFLWRKNLDFAAIQDIHSIKRQIDAHRGGGKIAIAGHNIKLGRGGIREIEFFAQTQQLIWGGRDPSLRAPATSDALAALQRAHHVSPEAVLELTLSYRFLRILEHRLQMIADAQTHSLPAGPVGVRHVALFMGFAAGDEFAAVLRQHLSTVERHYAHLFEEAPSLAVSGNLVFTGIEDDPDTLQTLARLGFTDTSAISQIVRGWHHGRYRSTRSQRVREILTELVPALLKTFGGSANPDGAFIRFDQFLARLSAGVQLFSLLHKNPALLELVAEIMGAGPRLAEEVARRPNLLDGVLSEGFFEPLPGRAALAAELGGALDRARYYENVLGIARRWVAERKFQVGVHLVRRRIDGEAAGSAFADIAETAIAALLPRVEAEFAGAHGWIKDGALVVMALGKLGSREMTVTSDLDLILIYETPDDVEASSGVKPLAGSTYYGRLCQRLINALTALTGDGNLYEVDMRLRPSGNKGPLALSLEAFRRYHDEAAWTWEQMALTRARAIAGPDALKARVMAAVRRVLIRPRDADRLVVDVEDMRQRVAEQHRNPPALETKHRRGGMVDVEFIAQYLQLRWAPEAASVLRTNTRAALYALAAADALPVEAEEALVHALTLWRNVQGLLKLTVEEPFDEAALAPALKALLAAGADAVDFAALTRDMDEAAARVRDWYERLVALPAAAARTRLDAPGSPAIAEEER